MQLIVLAEDNIIYIFERLQSKGSVTDNNHISLCIPEQAAARWRVHYNNTPYATGPFCSVFYIPSKKYVFAACALFNTLLIFFFETWDPRFLFKNYFILAFFQNAEQKCTVSMYWSLVVDKYILVDLK
jgi:hypothetical protein